MRLFPRIMFRALSWAARKGLREEPASGSAGVSAAEKKLRSRERGVRGETYAYWYLRRNGYVMIARNYTAPGFKGEIDLIGYDGSTLAFVEVRTRTAGNAGSQSAEESVTPGKWRVVARMAQHFLVERGLAECPYRFDLLAIENRSGQRPELRLHKGAFSGARQREEWSGRRRGAAY
ncbi:MAG: YraN family protein [Candidatus Acidiferrales bacterium]